MTRIARTFFLALMCFVLLTPVAATAATPETTYEAAVFKYTNAERTNRDLKALKFSKCVDKYAEKQAVRMRSSGNLTHQNMQTIMNDCGLRSVGENIAYGYSSGKKVTAAWMSSKGHKANILRGSNRLLGVGAVRDADGVWWVSQVFGTLK